MSPRKMAEQSHVFEAPGVHTVVDVSNSPMASFGLQAVPTEEVDSYTLRLEGSLNGTHWSTLLEHTQEAASGSIVFTVSPMPVKRLRLSMFAMSGDEGAAVDAYFIGMPIG